MDLSYILNILGEERDQYFNAVTPPIMQTSNFAFKTVADFRDAISAEQQHHVYSRGNNPTVEIVRKKIAALEGTDDCLVFSSGVAAIAAVLLHALRSGDHVICVKSPYSWTQYLLTEVFPEYQIATTFIDGRELSQFQDAIQPNTKLIYLESPNTATKYLAGHSDVVAGAVCANAEHIAGMFRRVFMGFGAVPSPHDAWLLLRGMRTLPIRLEKSASNAEMIVEHFMGHPKIERIIHPFHPSHPQFALAQKQMTRGCGLFAMILKTQNKDQVEAFCNNLERFLMAVSWGGYESLIVPACIKIGDDYPAGFVRFYAGLEEANVLIADIEKALQYID